MHRTATSAATAVVGAVLVLSGCRDDDARSDSPPPPGPTATSKAVPHAAARLAGRYRQFGGDRDVHGIQRKPGPGG